MSRPKSYLIQTVHAIGRTPSILVFFMGLALTNVHTQSEDNRLPNKAEGTQDQFEKEALAAHNRYRQLHRAKPLVWDREMAQVARRWSETQAREDKMYHSRGKYGENIYWRSNQNITGATAVDSWYSEVRLYNFSNPDMKKHWGHFSQIVWTDTKRLGCGRATSAAGGTYVTCVYDPPGNRNNEYRQKVLPPRR